MACRGHRSRDARALHSFESDLCKALERKDERGTAYANLRRSRFKQLTRPDMFRDVDKNLLLFRALNGSGSAHPRHLRRPAARSEARRRHIHQALGASTRGSSWRLKCELGEALL